MPRSLYRFIKQDQLAVRENMTRSLRNAGLLILFLIGAIAICFVVVSLLP